LGDSNGSRASADQSQARGKPSRGLPAVFIVFGPEGSPQMRLFVQDDEQLEAERDRERVAGMLRAAIENGPPQDHGQHADVHWVSRVTVEAADHESSGSVGRERRPTPE